MQEEMTIGRKGKAKEKLKMEPFHIKFSFPFFKSYLKKQNISNKSLVIISENRLRIKSNS